MAVFEWLCSFFYESVLLRGSTRVLYVYRYALLVVSMRRRRVKSLVALWLYCILWSSQSRVRYATSQTDGEDIIRFWWHIFRLITIWVYLSDTSVIGHCLWSHTHAQCSCVGLCWWASRRMRVHLYVCLSARRCDFWRSLNILIVSGTANRFTCTTMRYYTNESVFVKRHHTHSHSMMGVHQVICCKVMFVCVCVVACNEQWEKMR